MIRMKKSLAVLTAAACLALAACGSSTSSEPQPVSQGSSEAAAQSESAEGEKVLRFGQASYGETIDMQISTGSLAAAIADEVTESLLRFDDNNVEEPVLITDFPSISEDGKVYSFELKEGVQFSDGTDLKASDVKFTFERMFTPATGAKSFSYFSMIEGAQEMLDGKAAELSGFEIQDDRHFTITLTHAYAPFLKNLGTSYADIFPEKACLEAGSNWGVDTNLIGTGPYVLTENDGSTQAVLTKNPNYHGGEVNLDRIEIKFYSDNATKLLAYENGDIDLTDLPAALLQQYQQSNGEEITIYHPLGTAFLSLNLNNEVLSDLRVREAISLAIDREELVEYVLGGAGIPATTYLNPEIPGHDKSLSVYEFNVEKAKELLAEAGYPDGVTIDGGEVRQSEHDLAVAIQGYLANAGITLNFDTVDNATWNGDRASGNLPFTFITWNALYADADFQIYNYFYSANSARVSVNYNNPDFDKLMDDGRAATDETARAEIYQKADQLLSHEDMACVPLYYPQSQFLAKPYVKDMKVGNLIYHLWNVDIDLAEQQAAK